MAYPIEELVRRMVGGILRAGQWQGKFLCQPCLERLALEQIGKSEKKAVVGQALAQVFKDAGALAYMPTYLCARCGKTMPCLGATQK